MPQNPCSAPALALGLILTAILAALVVPGCSSSSKPADAPARLTERTAELERALEAAGSNRTEIERALARVPADQAFAMAWLVERMPREDLETLRADFLIANCDRAFQAWRTAPWHAQVPEEVFLDAILPYSSVNEKREAWWTEFRGRCLPMIAGARTPGQAAAIINQQIFNQVNVRYSTKRPKPDQSPSESMAATTASCTGLSILLIDACRSVGIPARFVGTALWSDRSGNHSWVEVWDNGWQFTGAAEATGDVLNQGWFTDRASTARRDDPEMAIYAVTWRDTNLSFPMVWRREDTSVRAVNVTDRYVALRQVVPEGHARLRIKVARDGSRAAVAVTVVNAAGEPVFTGTSKDERFDSNDHLTAVLPLGSVCTLNVEGAHPRQVTVERDEQLVEIEIPAG